jgi:hypothetical protein
MAPLSHGRLRSLRHPIAFGRRTLQGDVHLGHPGDSDQHARNELNRRLIGMRRRAPFPLASTMPKSTTSPGIPDGRPTFGTPIMPQSSRIPRLGPPIRDALLNLRGRGEGAAIAPQVAGNCYKCSAEPTKTTRFAPQDDLTRKPYYVRFSPPFREGVKGVGSSDGGDRGQPQDLSSQGFFVATSPGQGYNPRRDSWCAGASPVLYL